MNTHFLYRFTTVALVGVSLIGAVNAAPVAKKPPVTKVPVKPKPDIKKTPQMAGAVGRFGELYGLKSGWTFQILSARYSYDAFDDYNQLYPTVNQKLLVLQVALKNGTPDDKFLNTGELQFQIQDSNNQTFEGGSYRLSSSKNKEFSLNLKPGQGVGQDPKNRLEVAIPIAEDSKVSKIVLKQGRKGTSEDVMRFFVAGTQGGDAKNAITHAPNENSATPIKAEGFFPSRYYQFRINGVTFVSGPIGGNEAPENRRFAVVNLTLKNATSISQGTYEFTGDSYDKQLFTDADGETYTASSDIGLLKVSADEQTSGDIAPGQEKTVRLVFAVPKTGELKTLSIGSTNAKRWVFDAAAWK